MSVFSALSLGLQFDSESLVIVETRLSNKPKATRLLRVPLEEGQVQKGNVQDAEHLGKLLKDALFATKPAPVSGKKVSLCINEEFIFRKVIDAPITLQGEQLLAFIRAEVGQYLPEDVEVMELDYQIVPESVQQPIKAEVAADTKPEKTEDKKSKGTKVASAPACPTPLQQVAVVAVEKSIIHDWMAVLSIAKLEVASIEPRANALCRALVSSSESAPILITELIRNQYVASLVRKGVVIVSAVGQVMNAQTEDEQADVIADELGHLVKLYQNRAASPEQVKGMYLLGTDPERRQKLADRLKKLIDQDIHLPKARIEVAEVVLEADLAAVGASLFSVASKLNER